MDPSNGSRTVCPGARASADREVPLWGMTKEENDTSQEAVIDEALGVIDGALAKMMQRELVSSGEVADLLLDVRSLLTTDHDADIASAGEPVSDPA
jgi:hypothetical protein